MYSEKTIRRKANEIGFVVSRGFQHYLYNGAVVKDYYGVAYTGYVVEDMTTGYYVWGCYDQCFDHIWTIEDVDEFIRGEYERAGMNY